MSPVPPVASPPRKKRRRSKDKGPFRQGVEYALVMSVLSVVRWMPLSACRALAAVVGEAVYRLVPRRRRIARINLGIAFPNMDAHERERVVRTCCRSFLLTALEGAKFLSHFDRERAMRFVLEKVEGSRELLEQARRLHEESGGCVFVVPHLGNWEFLAYAGTLAGVPLTIPVRPLDNKRLEKALYGMRAASGQEILPKRNVFFHLREALRKGRSVAILADQHAGAMGIDVPFFGRPASTIAAPAVLALHFNRPIVLVACLRRPEGKPYEAILSEPIRANPDAPSQAREVERLTTAVNRATEDLIRRRPEQYLWLHDRWKLMKHWGRRGKRAVGGGAG